MDSKIGIRIMATGRYFPDKILTNHDLEKMVETSDAWITERTGIKQRRIAESHQATSDLATEAARIALKKAAISGEDLDGIIVATITPDMFFPSTACFVQKNLGAKKSFAFDLSAACSGFIYSLGVAAGLIRNEVARYILVIGAETLSRFTDWQDRNTCVLFGDAAGAMVLGPNYDDDSLLSLYLRADGSYHNLLYMPGGASRNPATPQTVSSRLHYMKMEGREVFKVAVTKMEEAAEKALELANLKSSDIALLIPHQANMRIIEALIKRFGFPREKVAINLDRYGNTSAATIITALDEAIEQKRVKHGDKVLMAAFGGGFTWAGAVIKL